MNKPILQSLHVQNFRCLKDITIDFEPLTVLLGPNASGKSTVLRVLRREFLKVGVYSVDFWRRDKSLPMEIMFQSDFKTFALEGDLTKGWSWKSNKPIEFKYQELCLDLTSLRSYNQLERQNQLDASGKFLTNLFATLTRKQQEKVSKIFCQHVPMFRDVDTCPLGAGQHALHFQDRWKESEWYQPQDVSDGTMLMLAYLMLPFQPERPDILAIEEPERGLHPYLLKSLIKLLRELSQGIDGQPPIQVVLATHSPEILEYVQPEEVRFLSRRREDGSVEVRKVPPPSPERERAFEEYKNSLAELWLSGNLGGVPGI